MMGLAIVTGLRDHTRTWTFDTTTSADDCLEAFEAGLIARGRRWELTRATTQGGQRKATATFAGAELRFLARPGRPTRCWMTTTCEARPFTLAARLFRAAMHRVERQLRRRDADLTLKKT